MTAPQLGPPPVAASRGGSAPSGGRSATDGASGTLTETGDGGFVAVLEGHTAPATSDASANAAQNPDAAGPQTGELPTEVVADADASAEAIVAPADVAAVIAAAVVVAAPAAVAAASAAPVTDAPDGTVATPVAPVAATASAPVQPLPGLVPAVLDGDSAVAPMSTQAQAAALAAAADAPVTGTTPATAGGATAPAASLTLTLSQAPAEPVQGQVAPVVMDDAPVPAPAPRQDAAAAVPKTAEAPAAPVLLATPAPATPHVDPLGGLSKAGALTTPHELARELGHKVQMAVREGGRELLINLRPPELGHLTIRVTMTDGVLQAQIVADRPEAARLLQQSLSHLDASLGDLGYSLDSLDVAFSGQDPRDAHSSSRGQDAPSRGGIGEADGMTPSAGPSVLTAAGAAGGLDLLA